MMRAGRRVDLLQGTPGRTGWCGAIPPAATGCGCGFGVCAALQLPLGNQDKHVSEGRREGSNAETTRGGFRRPRTNCEGSYVIVNLAFLRTPDASKQVGLVLKEAQRADAEHPAASSRSQAPELDLKLRPDASLLSADAMEGQHSGLITLSDTCRGPPARPLFALPFQSTCVGRRSERFTSCGHAHL